MRVLVTGALGNVGRNVVQALLEGGHTVRGLDLPTGRNRRAARRLAVEMAWADLRRPEQVAAAVADQEAVVHLAFIVPHISATGIEPEGRPDLAYEVNVGGTRNLLAAMEAMPRPARLVFASSVHVFGRTQHLAPCRTADEPVSATDHYSQHKILCEEMVRRSRLEWCVCRLGAVLPLNLRLDRAMFDLPLDNRIEILHPRDAGQALANAAVSDGVWGKVLLIGGGPRCQVYYGDLVRRVLGAMGVDMLPEKVFGREPYCVDWMDTRESEALLHYQQRSLEDYVADVAQRLGPRRLLASAFRPLVQAWLVWQALYAGAAA